jgi:hypothetical protein
VLARELLNDWDTFWEVLDDPELPLSKNEPERVPLHWFIARRIGMGTRTPAGSDGARIRGGSHAGARLRVAGVTAASGDVPLPGGVSPKFFATPI